MFLEERMPIGIRRGTSGGPTARRKKHYTDAGLVSQISLRSYPLQRYNLEFGKMLLEHADLVRDFFYVVMFGAPDGGAYSGFRVRDWNDYELKTTNSRLVAVDGGFQLCRIYTVGAAEYVRPIRKVEDGTVTIYNGVTPVSATVDPDTAIVTSGGNASYTAEGFFDIPVTFYSDEALSNVRLGGTKEDVLQELESIELEELPLVGVA